MPGSGEQSPASPSPPVWNSPFRGRIHAKPTAARTRPKIYVAAVVEAWIRPRARPGRLSRRPFNHAPTHVKRTHQ